MSRDRPEIEVEIGRTDDDFPKVVVRAGIVMILSFRMTVENLRSLKGQDDMGISTSVTVYDEVSDKMEYEGFGHKLPE